MQTFGKRNEGYMCVCVHEKDIRRMAIHHDIIQITFIFHIHFDSACAKLSYKKTFRFRRHTTYWRQCETQHTTLTSVYYIAIDCWIQKKHDVFEDMCFQFDSSSDIKKEKYFRYPLSIFFLISFELVSLHRHRCRLHNILSFLLISSAPSPFPQTATTTTTIITTHSDNNHFFSADKKGPRS